MANIEVAIRKSADKKITYSLDIAYAEDPTLISRLDELNGEVVGVTSSAKIAAAIESKEAIADAVNAKGGNITADTPLDEYAAEIQTIPVSVVGKHSDGPRVRFFDYDGTLLKTQYVPKGGSATAPEIPQHERLLFQEWNNDFDNIMHDLDIGAIYTTKSGKCEFDVCISPSTLRPERTVRVRVYLTSGTVTVEWGDGTVEEISATGVTSLSHNYPACGKYMLQVAGTGAWSFNSYSFTSSGLAGTNGQDVFITAMRLAKYKALRSQSFSMLNSCTTLSLDRDFVSQGQSALFSKTGIVHVNLPRGFSSQWDMFSSTPIRHLVIPEDIILLSEIMANCTHFEDIVLPQKITAIPQNMFNGTYIQNVTVPVNVSSIGKNAFNTQYLQKIIMRPETPPTTPNEETFNQQGYLKEIIVPKGCAEAYKSATNWSEFADIIKEEEE
jgi:hypothetical protein